MKNIMRTGMLGLAIGDALGVPVEFRDRKAIRKEPVTDMRGYGTHYQPAGTWSDDTAMALACADSLRRGFDLTDMMERFQAWEQRAQYTAGGVVFDEGLSVRDALAAYRHGKMPLLCGGRADYDNGNGSLMRIFPAAVWCAGQNISLEQKLACIGQISALTHGHPRSVAACRIFSFVVWALMEEPTQAGLRRGLQQAQQWLDSYGEPEAAAYARLFAPSFADLPEKDIASSGYVVHTLEAAVWCVLTTGDFRQCVLKAVNLGADTDTTGAVAGALAALIYGEEGIPAQWVQVLRNRALLEEICAG